MSEPLFVKPADPDAIVPQPDRDMRPLAVGGEYVADTGFWRRRLADGDVVLADPPTIAPPAPAAE